MFCFFFFFFNDTATTEIYTGWYTLSLHDALPILRRQPGVGRRLPPVGNLAVRSLDSDLRDRFQLAGASTTALIRSRVLRMSRLLRRVRNCPPSTPKTLVKGLS